MDAILKKVPGPSQAAATSLLASLDEKSGQIAQLIASKDVTGATEVQNKALADLSKLEELIAADTKPVSVPSEFDNLPRLNKRAVVEFTVKKPPGEQARLGLLSGPATTARPPPRAPAAPAPPPRPRPSFAHPRARRPTRAWW